MRLAKWQKNCVFEAIQKAGLRPEEFGWEGGSDDDRLTHLTSQAYFVFGGAAGKYRVRYAAGDTLTAELEKYSWSGVMTSVEVWLSAVKADKEMPDLWSELSRQREPLRFLASEATGNAPFTAGEQVEIRKQLQVIQEHLKELYALSGNESRALDERLAYIEQATGRLGRIDWRTTVMGVMLGAIVTATLPPDAVRTFFEMLFDSVGQLLSHHHLLG